MTATMQCSVCWFVFDPALGDEDAGIAPGTPFDALPDAWRCPRCETPRARFVHGVEEGPPDDHDDHDDDHHRDDDRR